jgi:hypothetical protein
VGGGGFKSNFYYVLLASLLLVVYLLPLYSVFLPVITPAPVDGVRLRSYTGGEGGRGYCTGRQLPPLSSVLYRIISKRRYILAAQLLPREKSGT